jgi:replicative DNA helicase
VTNVVPLEPAVRDRWDRIPPVSIDTEIEILGAVLMNPAALAQVEASLRPDHFSEPVHRAIYAAMLAAGEAQQPLTTAFIIQHYGQRAAGVELNPALAPEVTVREYISRLRIQGGAASQITSHAEVLQALWALRQIEVLGQDIGRRDAYDPGPYLAECFDKIDEIRSSLVTRRAHTATAAAAGRELVEAIRADIDGRLGALPSTGLTRLDLEIGGGLQPANLITVPARTSMGKSILGTEIVRVTAGQGFGSVYHSLEMHRRQISARMAASRLELMGRKVPYERMLRRRGVDAAEANLVEHAISSLADLPLVIEDGGGRTIAEIAASSERIANSFARRGVPLGPVVIDHAHIVRPGRAYKREDEGFKEVADGSLALAKRLDTTVILLAQCNRNPESRDDKRPSLADVRGAGAFEEDSDAVIFLYRPAYYIERSAKFRTGDMQAHEEHEATKHNLELIIDKNRAGRSNQVIPAWIDTSLNAIRNS